MKEQIEEMTKDLCDIECKGMKCDECDGYACEYRMLAEALYNAGYQKQEKQEWISVEERLPERNGRYLTHCNIENQSLVCVLYYCKIGGFNEGTVTHWMPLPEPPKKGGEE